MPARPIAAALLIVAAGAAPSPAQWGAPALPLPPSLPATVRPVVPLDANRAALRVPVVPGGGALDRFAADPDAAYAVIALTVRSDVPVLLLLDHDRHASIGARLLDAPPWEAPSMAQRIALEPRRLRWDDDRVIEGAWLIAPAAEPPRQVVLVVEAARPAFAPRRRGTDIVAELYDPTLPAPFRSLARLWASAGFGTDVPSPLERARQRGVQLLWPSPAAVSP